MGCDTFTTFSFKGEWEKTLGMLDRKDVMTMGLGTDGKKSGETSSALGKENTSV